MSTTGPLPAAVYPPRLLAAAPAAQHTAYVAACQAADELRDAQNPLGEPALNYRPTDRCGTQVHTVGHTVSVEAPFVPGTLPAVL